ncbi:MAG: beta-ketoacyl synthase N-terminal-like domain-containing protein [Desulfobacterales bacterium]
MSAAAIITGIGAVGGFGCGVAALAAALHAGTAGPAGVFKVRTAHVQADVDALLADIAPLADFVPKKALRRIDRFTRLALLGSCLALADARLDEKRRGRMGIIVATGYGSTCDTFDFLNTTVDEDDPCRSPIRFANSVHSAAAAHISAFLNEHGPTLTINQYDMSVPLAFLTACQWLTEDRVDSVLVGGTDEFSRAMGYYSQHLKDGDHPAAASAQAPVGEGSVFFVLEKKPAGPRGYARICSAAVGGPGNESITVPSGAKLIVNASAPRTLQPEKDRPAVSFTHLYGRLPVGSAFDIAVAAILLENGPHGPPDPAGRRQKTPLLCAARRDDHRDIGCLTHGIAGDSGLVVLAALEI